MKTRTLFTLMAACIFMAAFVRVSVAADLEKITEGHSLTGDFTQDRYLSGFDEPLKTKGVFAYVPTSGLAWVVTAPFVSRLIVTKEAVFQEIHNQVVELEGGNALASQISDLMVPLLSSDFIKLEQGFEIKEERISKDSLKWRLTMTPKQAGMQQVIQSVTVEGAAKTQKIVIHKPGDDRDEITFSKQVIFETAPPSLLAYFKLTEGQ